jgi:ribose transport system substrate-binding protein
MIIYKRHQEILSILTDRQEVTIEGLAGALGVSENTIRNDITALADKNLLRKVRGGAVAIENESAGFPVAEISRELWMIGRSAAEMVKDGDTILLDSGRASYALAQHLTEKRNLTVITNGLDTARQLAGIPGNTVMLVSNIISSDGNSTIGEVSSSISRRLFIPKFFTSCDGISAEGGITSDNIDTGALKIEMQELAQRLIVLADPRSVGRTGAFVYSRLDDAAHLITAEGVDPELLGKVRESAPFPVTIVHEHREEILQSLKPVATSSFRIGFGNLSDEFTFSRQVKRSIIEAAEQFPNVELLIRDNAFDPERTLQNADWFVDADVDLMIEYQLDASSGNVIMDKYNRSGIPVIAIDIPMPGATFFGADNYRAGYIAGENLGHWINKRWNGKFDYLIKLSIDRAGSLGSARLQGLREGLFSVSETIGDDHIITLNDMIFGNVVKEAVSGIIDTIPGGKRVAIIGMNDQAVIDAVNVFVDAGRINDVVGVGQNADKSGRQAIRKSDFPFIGSTRYAPEEYGDEILSIALKILQGAPVAPAIFKEHVFIDKDNIDRYYSQNT